MDITQQVFLNQLINDIKWSISIAQSAFLAVPVSVLNFKENPKKWSIAQCVDHINIVNWGYIKKLDDLLLSYSESIDPKAHEVRHGIMGKFMLTFIDTQRTYKFPSPKRYIPKEKAYDMEIIRAFVGQEEKLRHTFESYRTKNLNKHVISSPASKLLRLNLTDTFKLIIVHQKRHISQALEVLQIAENHG